MHANAHGPTLDTHLRRSVKRADVVYIDHANHWQGHYVKIVVRTLLICVHEVLLVVLALALVCVAGRGARGGRQQGA